MIEKERVCKKCNKIFKATSPNQLYCSKECKEVKKQRKVCVICGNEFYSNRGKYTCSEKCAKEYDKIYQRKYKQKIRFVNNIKTCVVCNKVFNSTNGKIACSEECNNKHIKDRYLNKRRHIIKNPTIYSRVCSVCGREFETQKHNAKYCSLECKSKAKLTRAKIYQASHYIKKAPKDYICKYCGNTFKASKRTFYCSPECKKKANSINRKRIYLKNKDKMRVQAKRYYLNNREKIKQKQREYYLDRKKQKCEKNTVNQAQKIKMVRDFLKIFQKNFKKVTW